MIIPDGKLPLIIKRQMGGELHDAINHFLKLLFQIHSVSRLFLAEFREMVLRQTHQIAEHRNRCR